MLINGFKKKLTLGVLCSALLLGSAPFALADTLVNNGSTAPASSSEVAPTGIQSIHYRVTASVLNVRSGPGTNFSIVGQVYKDDVVWYNPVLPWDVPDPWVPIYKGSLEGYVDGSYIMEF